MTKRKAKPPDVTLPAGYAKAIGGPVYDTTLTIPPECDEEEIPVEQWTPEMTAFGSFVSIVRGTEPGKFYRKTKRLA